MNGVKLNRAVEQWRNCNPKMMATEMSEAAVMYAFIDARSDILRMHAEIERLHDVIDQMTKAQGAEK